jgi:hypothetical protein
MDQYGESNDSQQSIDPSLNATKNPGPKSD